MRHTRFLSLLAFAGALFAQGTASLQFTQSFTNTTAGAVVSNGPTIAGGPQGSVGFRLVYYIQPGSGTVSALSVELDGAATQLGSYTALTPAPGGGSGSSPSTNPATTSPQGQNNLCCDFYPFLHIKVNTFTVATGSPILIVKVLGYAGTSAAANSGSGGGGGGLTCLNGDVLAGTGSCTSAEVVGLEGVPFCSGFTPTNGQFLKYTTGGSPNPCYTAAASITGGTCTTGQFVSAITAAGVITCGTPAGGGTIATTTNALVGDGAGNAIAASGTGTNCLLVNGGNQACSGGGSGGNGLTVYSGLAGVALSNATLYFPVGGGSLASTTETNVDALMESSGTISAFGASLSVALGTTIATNNTVVLTWRKNATGQTLTCTITNPATSCSDITHSFTYAAGDLLTIQAVFTGTISAAPVWVMSALAGGTSSSSNPQSYLGPGGYADRSGVILMTGTQSFNGSLNAFLIPNQNVGYFSGAVSGYIQFNFQVPLLITEATYNQENADAQGTWQFQGSTDGISFTNIGATFSLGGATSQVLTTLNGNTTRYQYLRLNGISGTTSSGPYVYAMLFKTSF